ncbi:murein L,D-transpeptidase family protein [Polynucleobacter sp. CS-Odin-A6]|uniref:L,D-transpeptidase family protein n=1 Tax=Polynucleobacter sp. CS-Odin-A6 TaxID=2689106 RepID=UPI001C0DCC41|nr:L,D-transpeptidase family protein [Polynucleobacter sp. CS-Odin-A6]MBU3621818.1 L,D-transpeptidase family protein [Polynucleobacter sp. CS-Odin-A6]
MRLKHLFIASFCIAPMICQANGDATVRQATQELVRNGNLDKAMDLLNKSESEHPNFRLATFMRAELLTALAGGAIANKAKSEVRDGEAPQNLLSELQLRNSVMPNLADLRPAQVLKMPKHADVLLIDASISRAYLLRNKDGDPVWEKDYFVTIGKLGVGKQKEGDLKSPLGVYSVTMQIPKQQLRSIFGAGALELSFPNALDKKLDISGSGIWLHGVPKDTYSRAPKASDGCLAFANDDVKEIIGLASKRQINVTVVPSVQWLKKAEWSARATKVSNEIAAFRAESLKMKTARPPEAIYAPESTSTLVIDQPIGQNDGSPIYREYWDKNGNSWNLKFKSRT